MNTRKRSCYLTLFNVIFIWRKFQLETQQKNTHYNLRVEIKSRSKFFNKRPESRNQSFEYQNGFYKRFGVNGE